MTRREALDVIGEARERASEARKAESDAKKVLGDLEAGQKIVGEVFLGLVKEEERVNLSRAALEELLGEKRTQELLARLGTKTCLVLHVERRAIAVGAAAN